MSSPLFISHNVLKFRLHPSHVTALLGELRGNLRRYEFTPGLGPTFVSTLYFDTPGLDFGREALRRPDENVRIRAREYYYDTGEGGPPTPRVWVELKEKTGKAVRKKRLRLHKGDLGPFLRGEDCTRALLHANPDDQEIALRHYRELGAVIGERELVPSVATHYGREEFRNAGGTLRVTLDREISYHRPPADLYETYPNLSRDRLGSELGVEGGSILEIKGNDGLPHRLDPIVCPEPDGAYSKYGTALAFLHPRGIEP